MFVLFFFFFFGPPPWHMEVPKPGVESKLHLLAYTTATAMQDLSCICELHHSSWQGQILNPLSKARDQPRLLMDPSWTHHLLSHEGNSDSSFFSASPLFFHAASILY